MRDIETIDGELRLLARVWSVARHMTGRTPSTAHIDDLLDERAAAARPWPLEPVDLLGANELKLQAVQRQVIDSALSKALVDGQIDPNLTSAELAHVRQRSRLTEDRIAQRLRVSRDRLAATSFRLWDGRTFGEERDRRAGPDTNPQKRGRVTRELRAELEKALADGNH